MSYNAVIFGDCKASTGCNIVFDNGTQSAKLTRDHNMPTYTSGIPVGWLPRVENESKELKDKLCNAVEYHTKAKCS